MLCICKVVKAFLGALLSITVVYSLTTNVNLPQTALNMGLGNPLNAC